MGGPGGPGGRPPRPRFEFIDADGSGLVTLSEFTDAMDLWRDVHEAFRTADTTRDGALTGAEYATGFQTAFSTLDADGDGSVTIREMVDWVETSRQVP